MHELLKSGLWCGSLSSRRLSLSCNYHAAVLRHHRMSVCCRGGQEARVGVCEVRGHARMSTWLVCPGLPTLHLQSMFQRCLQLAETPNLQEHTNNRRIETAWRVKRGTIQFTVQSSSQASEGWRRGPFTHKTALFTRRPEAREVKINGTYCRSHSPTIPVLALTATPSFTHSLSFS